MDHNIGNQPETDNHSQTGKPPVAIGGSVLHLELGRTDAGNAYGATAGDAGTGDQAVAHNFNLKETKAKPGQVMIISSLTDSLRITPRAGGIILLNILTFLNGK